MSSRRRRRPRPAPTPRSFLRRRSTLWLVAAVVTLAIGIVLGAIGARDDGEAPIAPTATPRQALTLLRTQLAPLPSAAPTQVPPTPTLAVALPDLQPPPDEARFELAQVVEVIDGDTIDVRLDGGVERVRYYGVDTPERGDDCFREATERNESLAADRVLLLPDPSPEGRERDRFGRLLRYVFDEQGRSIDSRLIAEGLALAWREDGAYRDELVALEEEVQAAGAGCLWED